MFIVKLKQGGENMGDIWLDSYEVKGDNLYGLYNAKSGKLIQSIVPLHNLAIIKDVGEFDRPNSAE